jgi:hypothetical protein
MDEKVWLSFRNPLYGGHHTGPHGIVDTIIDLLQHKHNHSPPSHHTNQKNLSMTQFLVKKIRVMTHKFFVFFAWPEIILRFKVQTSTPPTYYNEL